VEFCGQRVPEILLSGNHAAILKWRQEQALKKTRTRRPDLLGHAAPTGNQPSSRGLPESLEP
jgi:tRNA (guanine37-N1)-methyltransferase